MSNDNEKRLIYFETEEHLVRRLGAAVVVCWRNLPPEVRDALISKAERVLDKDADEDLDHHLRQFIAEHCRKMA